MSTGRTLSARPRSKAAETAVEEGAEAIEAAPAPVPAPSGKGSQNLQDQFLNYLRKNKTPVTMFLVKA